jgi:hypothetical protein
VGADEKALWRMQRLRQMQFGKASRFALAGARGLRRSRPSLPLTPPGRAQMRPTRTC